MLLSEFLEESGLSDDDAVARLNEAGVVVRSKEGERPLTRNDLQRRKPRPLSRPWARVFGVELPPRRRMTSDDGDAGGDQSASLGETGGRRRQESAPRRPEGAAIVLEAGAQKRIAGAYKFAGAALAAGAGSQGVAHVWADSSDKIAELWIEAAKENPWAARFVNMMSAGGPMGDLAAGHLYLAGATLYVLGAGIPGGDAVFAKYSRFRPVDVRPSANGSQRAEPAGEAVDEPAEGAVVDGQG